MPTPKHTGSLCVKQHAVEAHADETEFAYRCVDGSEVIYTYRPSTGTLADLSVSVDGEQPFQPCVGGGLVFESEDTRLVPIYSAGAATLKEQRLEQDHLGAVWETQVGSELVRYSLGLRMVNCSLVVEARVEKPVAVELRIGYSDGGGVKRAIEVPMLVWDWSSGSTRAPYPSDVLGRKAGRTRSPAVLLDGDFFLTAIFDWYVSDASFIYSVAEQKTDGAGFDGGAYYLPVIDQGRNPLREKLILTVSKDFQEVLPNIPNPPSPYTQLMRDRVYTHGISPDASATRHRNLGITAVATMVQSYHAASDRGGYRRSNDMGCADDWVDAPTSARGGMARIVRRAERLRSIGWLIGTYTLYCQVSPIFRVFAELPFVHDANGFIPATWPGTARPATGECLAYARRQIPKIEDAMGIQVLYSDGYTIFQHWLCNDYAPGVPGAGKFRETYEQIAQLYMTHKEGYQAPVLSEGGMQWLYSGLVDGNLARTQHNPWDEECPFPPPADIPDFQLLKIHLLTVDNCGNNYFDTWHPEVRDKFTAQTLAYGKQGLWTAHTSSAMETQAMSCRSYFTWHLAQKRYRCVAVEKILYHNGDELVDTSTIIKQGKERLGRIYTRYANAFESWVNLNERLPWTIEVDGRAWVLPPYGWFQRRKEEWGEFRNYAVVDDHQRRRMRVRDRDTLLVSAPEAEMTWEDIETDGTVTIHKQPEGGVRVVNISAFMIRLATRLLALPTNAKQVTVHVFDLEGESVAYRAVKVEAGWIDFSFLDQEQFALVYL